MLEHLTSVEYEPEVTDAPDEGFVDIQRVDAGGLLNSQIKTASWLRDLGATDDEELASEAETGAAVEAFSKAVTNSPDAKEAATQLTTPPAIRQIVGMLTGYEWAFVEEANKLRSMAVAKLVQETEHPDARVRLKALELLGKVTEVGLFTERISVKKEELTDDELNEKIRAKITELQKTVDAEAIEREDRNADAEDVEDATDDTDAEDVKALEDDAAK